VHPKRAVLTATRGVAPSTSPRSRQHSPMPLRPDDVFIPGGLPDTTYVPREHLSLEDALSDWLDGRQKPLLSVSGPTKSGKTVLIRKLVNNPIELSGGVIDTVDDFWEAICDELEVFTDHSLSVGAGEGDSLAVSGEANGGFVKASATGTTDRTRDRAVVRTRTASSRSAARRALRDAKRIIFIDDFHYIPSAEQLLIVRGLKDLIFDGLGVVVAAVPHRAYDVVRVEKEMTGRVMPLPVEPWEATDLKEIATKGFGALEVTVTETAVAKMADESFGSPYLMQTHCLNLCKANRELGLLRSTFVDPNWQSFFEQHASATSKSAFDLLKAGPPRSSRNARTLTSGVVTDIYGAVLQAISATGPRTTLPYEDLRASLREVLATDLPQRHEITNVLEQMTRIARDEIEGEPVLEYDTEYATLHLVDPYFAYYLRWAPESLKDISVRFEDDVE
jgi:hypothetical protein